MAAVLLHNLQCPPVNCSRHLCYDVLMNWNDSSHYNNILFYILSEWPRLRITSELMVSKRKPALMSTKPCNLLIYLIWKSYRSTHDKRKEKKLKEKKLNTFYHFIPHPHLFIDITKYNHSINEQKYNMISNGG